MTITDTERLEQPTPEQEKSKEADNARKFVTEPLSHEFLAEHRATTCLLITDWTETGKHDETKVVYKKFDSGDIQTLLISKKTINGNRTKRPPQEITEEEYKEYLEFSKRHAEKNRYQFTYIQNGIPFAVNYDEFAGGKLFMLDVDASTSEEKDLFNPNDFPAKLVEVSDDLRYSGHRIAEILQTAQ